MKDYKFGHGVRYEMPNKLILFGAFHPSPRNVNTGRLNFEMMVEFLEKDRVLMENDADLILLKNTTLQCSRHIKQALGINVVRNKENVSAIKILSRLLNLLGLKFKRVNRGYLIDVNGLNDGRSNIFSIWQQRDELMLASMKDIAKEVNNFTFDLELLTLQK